MFRSRIASEQTTNLAPASSYVERAFSLYFWRGLNPAYVAGRHLFTSRTFKIKTARRLSELSLAILPVYVILCFTSWFEIYDIWGHHSKQCSVGAKQQFHRSPDSKILEKLCHHRRRFSCFKIWLSPCVDKLYLWRMVETANECHGYGRSTADAICKMRSLEQTVI